MLLASSALELRAVLDVAMVASILDADSEAGEDIGVLYIVLSIVLASYVLEAEGLRLPDVVRVAPTTGADSEAGEDMGTL